MNLKEEEFENALNNLECQIYEKNSIGELEELRIKINEHLMNGLSNKIIKFSYFKDRIYNDNKSIDSQFTWFYNNDRKNIDFLDILTETQIKYENLLKEYAILKKINPELSISSDDPNQIDSLKKENQKLNNDIKELKEELQKEKINIEKTDIAYLKKHEKLMKLENEHNARGAGRKPKITQEQIAMIQMYRAQGNTLQYISHIMEISYGNVQKYSKL